MLVLIYYWWRRWKIKLWQKISRLFLGCELFDKPSEYPLHSDLRNLYFRHPKWQIGIVIVLSEFIGTSSVGGFGIWRRSRAAGQRRCSQSLSGWASRRAVRVAAPRRWVPSFTSAACCPLTPRRSYYDVDVRLKSYLRFCSLQSVICRDVSETRAAIVFTRKKSQFIFCSDIVEWLPFLRVCNPTFSKKKRCYRTKLCARREA